MVITMAADGLWYLLCAVLGDLLILTTNLVIVQKGRFHCHSLLAEEDTAGSTETDLTLPQSHNFLQ